MVNLPDRETFFNTAPDKVAKQLSDIWVPFDDPYKNEYRGDGKVIVVPSSESPGLLRYFKIYKAAAYSDEWTRKKFPGSRKQIGRAKLLEETAPGGLKIFRFMMTALLPFVKTEGAANVGLTELHELNAGGDVIDKLSATRFAHANGLVPETQALLQPIELRDQLAFKLEKISNP